MQEQINKTDRFLLNFRHLVNKTGMMDCEMAEKLGIHKVSLSRYFSERRIPKRSVLEKIGEYFHLPYDELLTRDLTKPEANVKHIQYDSSNIATKRESTIISKPFNSGDVTAAAVLMSKEQRAYLTTAARKYNLSLEAFILQAAIERAERAIGKFDPESSSVS